jgi:Skp family chaperone for outer membrane proteins
MRNNNSWLVCLFIGGLLAITSLAANAQTTTAPAETKPPAEVVSDDPTLLLKRVLDMQKSLETKLADIQRKLDSMSQFLGDQRASSFDTVDRRLRNIEDDLKDVKRSVERR